MTYFPEPAWSNIVSYQLDYKKAHTQIWPYIKIDRYKSLSCVKYKVGVHNCPSIRDVVPPYHKVHTSFTYTPEWKYSYCNYTACWHCFRNIFQGTREYEDELCEDCASYYDEDDEDDEDEDGEDDEDDEDDNLTD